jgi:peptide-methionine (S)-S-oxide reductase
LSEYRSGIYTHTEEQERIAKEVTEKVQKEHFTPKGMKIVTEIQPAGTWYDAEVGTPPFSSKRR